MEMNRCRGLCFLVLKYVADDLFGFVLIDDFHILRRPEIYVLPQTQNHIVYFISTKNSY